MQVDEWLNYNRRAELERIYAQAKKVIPEDASLCDYYIELNGAGNVKCVTKKDFEHGK